MKCPNCGNEVRGTFCTSCGARLNQDQQDSSDGVAAYPADPSATVIMPSGRQRGQDAPAANPAATTRMPSLSPGQPPPQPDPSTVSRGNPNATVMIPSQPRTERGEVAVPSAPATNFDKLRMQLFVPALVAFIFGAGHHIEHAVRHDTGFPLTSTPSPWTFNLLLYPLAAFGFYMMWRRNKLLPGMWLIVGVVPAIFVFIAHFSPIALDSVPTVYHYYKHAWAGVIAVGDVICLEISLIWLAITSVRVYRATHKWWG